MLFTYETKEDAVRALYGAAKENRLKNTQYFTRYFDDEWRHFRADDMPPIADVLQYLPCGPLTACVMIAKSINDRQICVRWDREYIGESALRWEAGPPVCEPEDAVFARLERAAAMTARD